MTLRESLYKIGPALRRFSSILLILAVAAVGSGVLRFAHEFAYAGAHAHAHAHADAGTAEHDHAEGHAPAHAPVHAPVHNPADCFTHAQLNLPMLQAGYVPLLVCLGLFVAFLTAMPVAVRSRRPVLRLACRGPPARRFPQHP